MGKIDIIKPATPGLLTPSVGYKPFRYPWAHDFWRKQQQVHWMPEEVPLGEDCKDWAGNLTDQERNLLTQIFRFFTQGDIEVQDNYMEHYARIFKPVELKMMMAAFSNMETVHVAAYALLLETIGMPESEFQAFLEYEEMSAKHDYMSQFGLAFDMGPVEGMTASDIKAYIRYIADWRLKQLGLPTVYGVDKHPLPWLTEILNGVEHANFFEARATEYSKGATQGDWHGNSGVWDMFDQAKKAKAAELAKLGA